MAGTRGLAQFKGGQLRSLQMRDRHFDVDNKIEENKINILWHDHREILEDTKIDVFSQVNDKIVVGLGELDITADLGGKAVSTGSTVEGVVPNVKVDIRLAGSEDFPKIDEDGDRVYGRIEHVASPDEGVTPERFVLKFYSEQGGAETPYVFGEEAENIDFRYTLRTNMSIIPVDAIINGGAGFVEGATDANAYMNLNQLMKDIYGGLGTLDNDGNANLETNIVKQIADEINARAQADQDIIDNLASTVEGEGADLVGVVVDAEGNYVGTTVQEVLTELAAKAKADHDEFNDRLTKLETEEEEEVYEAVGGETGYMLVNGKAKPKTVMLFLNGQLHAPGINFDYILDDEGAIIGFDFAPDELEVVNGVPDVLFIKYKKIL